LSAFEPFAIRNIEFKNRLLRSSIGGRTCTYGSFVTDVWKNFELRFANGGVAGIISTTFHIEPERQAPFEYPSIADDKFIKPLAARLSQIKATGCRYIIQIGDPGYAMQSALFSGGREHSLSSSSGFDFWYGHGNRRVAMTEAEIQETIERFAKAAERCELAGADGVEITAEKGYIIHQFLNPGFNRRTDRWGGSTENRFRMLSEVIKAVKLRVSPKFIVGVRLSAIDFNAFPVTNVRLPMVWPLRHYFVGNGLAETVAYSKQLEGLGVDFLHVVSGTGFINPKGQPGDFPYDEIKIFCNLTRHLSFKASVRAGLFNLLPRPVGRVLFGIDWRYKEAINLAYAEIIKRETTIPIISNGGYQSYDVVTEALNSGKCDFISMARALIANPGLVKNFAEGVTPDKPCTYCNRCAGRTATSPLGCYEPKRFSSLEEMEESIFSWNRPDIEPTSHV
jgi:2,4-dienoyl-CoA reductase-like NADH-dependent reductase (Old Yellow Enzyme family)